MSEPRKPNAPKGGTDGDDDRTPATRIERSREPSESGLKIPDQQTQQATGPGAMTGDAERDTLVGRAPSYDDLSADSLLRGLARVNVSGRDVPSLHGIQIVRKIGHGAMGAVYLGFKPLLRQFVAVKVLPMHLAELSPQLIERFIREAQLAASIESPHLIRVTDVNESEGLFFLVMEFVDGVSAGVLLRSLRDAAELLDEASALDICIAAGSGLAAAHARGIIHRDVKPDNILLPRPDPAAPPASSRAKLADLGLARSEALGHSLTGADMGMGTAGYMAPEQAVSARTAGKQADVFGLGATLYAMLAVRPPFTGESAAGIIMKTIQEPHTPIRELRADVSEPTAALLDRCLAKDPSLRFVDASALTEGLIACRAALGERSSAAQALERLEALSRVAEVGEKLRPPSSPSAKADQPSSTSADGPAATPTFLQTASTPAQSTPTLVLTPSPPSSSRRRAIAILGFVAVALVALIIIFRIGRGGDAPPRSAVATTTIEMISSTDRERWVRWAADAFSRTDRGRDIRLSVKAMHGADAQRSLLEGGESPLLLLLSNDLSSGRFSAQWIAKRGSNPFARREVLSLSPQVFVMFEDRHAQFVKHYGTLDFVNLGDALSRKRWKEIGGPESWGPITFALSDRSVSLNGLAVATLAAYEATGHDETLTLDEVRSRQAQLLLGQLDRAFRVPGGGDEIMKELVLKGPSEYDGVCIGESSAIEYLESAEDRWGPIRVVYPDVNLWNESTIYLMNRTKATSAERAAANAFIDFLLGDQAQEQLVALGLRPVSPSVRLQSENSPFVRLAGKGIRREVPVTLAPPSAEVIAELVKR